MENKLFLDIMTPRGSVETVFRKPAPRLSDLNGKTIAFIDNKKSGARAFLNQIKLFFERDFPGIRFIDLSKKHNENYRIQKYMDRLRGIDAAVYSTGD